MSDHYRRTNAYLVPRQRAYQQRDWGHELPTEGLWKVTGNAGSGVTSLLIDTFVEATLRAPEGASGVLFLTDSKESAARVRAEISDALAGSDFVSDGPMVRSVHSLAFALLRREHELAGQQGDVRLISGAEQDAVIRQLLAGHAEDQRGSWPEELRPALPMVGFARQLRDFLLRAIERELDANALRSLGAQYGREIWAAAGDFLEEYRQVMALSGVVRYSASELIAGVLQLEFASQWHTVIVDDAQDLSPAAAAFVQVLLQDAQLGVVGGDLEQSVFQFRGASPRFFRDLGGMEHQLIDLGASRRTPQCRVLIAPDRATEYAAVADALRRAHLEQQVPFRDMAVVVRSSGMLEPVRRALLHAGVPVALNPTDVVLSQQRIVASLLLGLQALYKELDPSQWRDLLLGPIGGTDPVTLRRLLRGIRRWKPEARAETTLHELLVAPGSLPDFGSMLTDRELATLQHIRTVLDKGRSALEEHGTVEEVLWEVWNATGLAEHYIAVALRGGTTGSQADRDLDAVMALFDAAGDFTERKASGGIELFVRSMLEQELPTGVRDRRAASPDAVALLTAHGVAGREFARVVVAGVQENVWPSLGETGSLFGQQDLVDLIDADVDPNVPVNHLRERLLEEQRLFHLALSRATTNVLVTAVDQPDGDEVVEPSRFVAQLCQARELVPERVSLQASSQPDHDDAAQLQETIVRVLARDEFLGEMRRVLASSEHTEADRNQAARQLARLAQAGVSGAHPTQWWTTKAPSTDQPLELRKKLSPSRIAALLDCPMKSVLERTLGFDMTMNTILGSVGHAYFEAIGKGVDEPSARQQAMALRRDIDTGPEWGSQQQLREFEAMLERAYTWHTKQQVSFTPVGVEVDISVEVADELRIVGRTDRLERDERGAIHIVDLKTGASPVSNASVEQNQQLTAYQLALAKGTIVERNDEVRVVTASEDESPVEVGSALLVYPNSGKKTLTVRTQAAKTSEQLEEFLALVRPLPEKTTGPLLEASTGDHCKHCAVKALCPVQPEGKTIHHG